MSRIKDMLNIWRMYRFIKVLQKKTKRYDKEFPQKPFHVGRMRFQPHSYIVSYLNNRGWRLWRTKGKAADILDDCTNKNNGFIELIPIEPKAPVKLMYITTKGRDFANWTGLIEEMLRRRSRIAALITGGTLTAIGYFIFQIVRNVI